MLDEFGDIVISTGSMTVGVVDYQIVEAVMVAVPGELREVPTIGMNVRSMSGGIVDPFFSGKLKTQLKTQHLNPKKIYTTVEEIGVEL